MRRSLRRLGLVTFSVGFALMGPAFAAGGVTDNLVPNGAYPFTCHDSDPQGNGPVCQTDNNYLTVWFQNSVGSGVESTVRSSLDGSYAGTDLTVHYAASPSYSGSAETDIIYQVDSSGMSGSTVGFTWCNDAVSNIRCDQQYVRFKNAGVVDRELACHETGHGVGLLHGADADPVEANSDGSLLGCMETPDTGNHPNLQSNNVDNINSVY